MAIHRYIDQPLEPGMWVNPESMMLAGLAGHPAVIHEVTGKSVQIRTARIGRDGEVELDAPRRKLKTSIVFLCDTLDDAIAVSAASQAHCNAETRIEAEQRRAAAARKRAAIDRLVGLVASDAAKGVVR